jgi:hypothetical protein
VFEPFFKLEMMADCTVDCLQLKVEVRGKQKWCYLAVISQVLFDRTT